MTEQIERVLAYYRSTNFDYEHFWSGKKAQALHFGYYDSPVTSHEKSLQNMNRELAKLASIRESDAVLDAGCGYGGSAIWLSENIGCGVTGATVVPYQVKKAQKLSLASPAAKRLQFIQSDYTHTNLPDDSFDVVWGLESIVHCEDKAAFIREAFRLLRPGGRLLISEYLLRDEPPLSSDEHLAMKPFLDGWMMPDLLSPSEYKALYRLAGFGNPEIYDLSPYVEPSLRKCRHNASLAMPFIGPLKRLRLIDTIRHDYTIANYQLYDTFSQGLWQYKVVVGTKPTH